MTQHYAQIAGHPACSSGLRSDLALLRERLDEALQVLGEPHLRAGYDQRLELGETRVVLRQTPTGTFSLDDFARKIDGVSPPGKEALAGDLEPHEELEAPKPPLPEEQPEPFPLLPVGDPTPEDTYADDGDSVATRNLRRFLDAVEDVVDDDDPQPASDDTARIVGLPNPLPDRRDE